MTFTKKPKGLIFLLIISLVLSTLNFSAFAAEEEDAQQPEITAEEETGEDVRHVA